MWPALAATVFKDRHKSGGGREPHLLTQGGAATPPPLHACSGIAFAGGGRGGGWGGWGRTRTGGSGGGGGRPGGAAWRREAGARVRASSGERGGFPEEGGEWECVWGGGREELGGRPKRVHLRAGGREAAEAVRGGRDEAWWAWQGRALGAEGSCSPGWGLLPRQREDGVWVQHTPPPPPLKLSVRKSACCPSAGFFLCLHLS